VRLASGAGPGPSGHGPRPAPVSRGRCYRRAPEVVVADILFRTLAGPAGWVRVAEES
jgi:hypothetical protein